MVLEGAADGSWRGFVGSTAVNSVQDLCGDHETLWALCLKSPTTSRIELGAAHSCHVPGRQLELCSPGPWLSDRGILVGKGLASSALLSQQRRFARCHLEAQEQQVLTPPIPASHPHTYRSQDASEQNTPSCKLLLMWVGLWPVKFKMVLKASFTPRIYPS